MFVGATSLLEGLQRTMHVSSFFERGCSGNKHSAVQKAFVMFLVNHGYLYSASGAKNYERQAEKPSGEVVPCDAIFDVEDVSLEVYLSVSSNMI